MHVDVSWVSRGTRCNCADTIRVAADVENRNIPQTTLAGIETAGLIGDPHGVRISPGALLRHDNAVDVMSANPPVEFGELVECDDAVVERLQTILDTFVVPWTAGMPGLRIDTVNVDQVILIRTMHLLPLRGLGGLRNLDRRVAIVR